MLKINNFTVNSMSEGCVTDELPRFSFSLESNHENVVLKQAILTIDDWVTETTDQIEIPYTGPTLLPFTEYTVQLKVTDNYGEVAEKELSFETGKMSESFKAKWITFGDYQFKEKKVSPKPIYFRRKFSCDKKVKKAHLYSTALGIYEAKLNDNKIGLDYFAPGFTSYRNYLQYQTYDITEDIQAENELQFVVAGGWAVGAFTYARRNRVYAKRQALLSELHLEYEDGSKEVIGTDSSWQVTMDGNMLEAEFYNGEIFDATVNMQKSRWSDASLENVKIKPQILAQYGLPVRAQEEFQPISHFKSKSGVWIYDFGQNFAGIISAKINGKLDQKITIKHAEILMDGELFTEPLRTAKQEIVYICKEGEQNYSPSLTYMGFRYIGIRGIEPENIQITAKALYSDMKEIGDFECSNAQLNQLQSNIKWGAKSNFVDVPTDCPQRDERMPWTGDIALFGRTAAYNFNTRRFFDKWLLDVKAEQNPGGGIPVTVPLVRVPTQGEIMFPMAVDHWGDACILVPWAEYLARGDVGILRNMYPTMKKYVKACEFWAKLFSVGKRRRIWLLWHHYGDWVAPEGGLWTWMSRGRFTGTASLANTSRLLSQIASILGESEDAAYYRKVSEETSDAYQSILLDKDGRIKGKKEFQTGYVLPLYYEMLKDKTKKQTAGHLARIVRENNHHIGTGFPGTPYILFALADNGYVKDAYKMLLKDTSPSWLFEIKAGATTIWERWDALREDGTSNTGANDGTNGMVSFNHYAAGAVGDFMYRRIAGIESITGGYKTFKIDPIIGGGLTYAKAEVETAFGKIQSLWKIEGNQFVISVQVPVNSTCYLHMPSGVIEELGSGEYCFTEHKEEEKDEF
ncbi:family 78 glycoside hydrolase catalytic domain [Fundicoccus sp. Sow4_F4]|uniref:alpha-L-rhamnosidase n=1 Tax=Fundicoccus sp. Sow4_F4 TaxID=3438783 RepID=UPI003F913E99